MMNDMTGAEALSALQQVDRSRRLVVDEIDMPRWYWWGLATGWVVLALVIDLANPWVGTAATFAFGTIHASVAQRVLAGRRRTSQLSVRADISGRHTQLVMLAALMGLGVVTVGAALAAHADGAGHPVTMAAVLVAVLIVLGGPRLMAAVRRRAVDTLDAP